MSEYFIGLTGGIASGKSALEKAFAAHGIVVADADLLAREVVQPGTPALAAVVERFGNEVLQADGQLDRAALRVRVFGHDAERRALEAILHPAIRRRLEQICRQATSPYAIATVPLLAEGGGRAAYPWLHRILVVDTPTEVQKRRLMQRDGIDAVLAEKMMAAQASRAVRLALADDIVVNDGDIAHLQRAAGDLHRRYLALAEAGNTHSMANNRPL
ncbi:dephospho-CoA kinase [Pseudoxanthomonas sp.]|jgi:dephospho-CoA kinase|uniref:dephospho-CoA kinase n=1 Tax=Pseudoxanthomonas sp. TaxID=1871049 RepID=UPI002E11A17B|nr:dephospho-CoA kinase [Pseudoxanthomonas sp.]HEV7269653.1 dephospho-CoA kinase [Pseudoxanthomonas sp.]